MTKRIIVDKNDTVIEAKERSEIDFTVDIYRVASLWLTNLDGKILIAQRALTLRNGPGLWGPAVAGTLDEKATTYKKAIIKEAREEIGLTGVDFLADYKFFQSGPRSYFCYYFTASVDWDQSWFTLQPDEVAAVKWIDPAELKDDHSRYPEKYVEGFGTAISHYIQ